MTNYAKHRSKEEPEARARWVRSFFTNNYQEPNVNNATSGRQTKIQDAGTGR